MIIGFTGTRDGTTDDQRFAMRKHFERHRPTVVHHGCCVGADEDMVTLAAGVAKIVGHVPEDTTQVSKYALGMSDEITKGRRDGVLVDEIWVAPKDPSDEAWLEMKTSRPVVIFWPNGTTVRKESAKWQPLEATV
jgi:hypothetical protein